MHQCRGLWGLPTPAKQRLEQATWGYHPLVMDIHTSPFGPLAPEAPSIIRVLGRLFHVGLHFGDQGDGGQVTFDKEGVVNLNCGDLACSASASPCPPFPSLISFLLRHNTTTASSFSSFWLHLFGSCSSSFFSFSSRFCFCSSSMALNVMFLSCGCLLLLISNDSLLRSFHSNSEHSFHLFWRRSICLVVSSG